MAPEQVVSRRAALPRGHARRIRERDGDVRRDVGRPGRLGRDGGTGGYRRYAWTAADLTLREWFAGEAAARGLDLTSDRAGNQWAWWGDPDAAGAGDPGSSLGSHLDSVPDGGAFDGPLGVVSALAAIDALRDGRVRAEPGRSASPTSSTRRAPVSASPAPGPGSSPAPSTPTARAGSATPTASPWPRRSRAPGRDPHDLGPDDETLARVGTLRRTARRAGPRPDRPGRAGRRGRSIWPHGRWRIELPGEANHAGTTRLEDRRDPMLAYAAPSCCRAVSGQPARARGHLRQGARRAERRQRDPVPGHGLARRARADRDAVEARRRARRPHPRSTAGRSTRILDRLHGVRRPSCATTWPTSSAARPCWRPARVTTPASSPRRASGRRCCSSATPPAISHSPAEFAERDDCQAGVARAADRGRSSWRRDRVLRGAGPGCPTASPARSGSPSTRGGSPRWRRRRPRCPRTSSCRASCCPASPTPTATPSTARCGAGRTTAAAPSGPGARPCTPWPRGSIRTTTSSWPAPSSARWRWPASPASASSTTSTTTRRHALRRPERHGRGLVQAAAEAGIRITLLDTCYLSGGLGEDGPLPLSAEQRRFSDGTAAAWARRFAQLTDRRPRSHRGRDPLGAGRAPRGAARGGGSRARTPAARPSVRAAGRERAMPARLRPDSDGGAGRGRGAASPTTTAVHATHLSGADIAALGGAGVSVSICPTTERDLADGIGPARALRAAGSPITLGSDQNAVVDLLEEARALEMDERLASGQRGRFTPHELLTALTADGHRALGWSDVGRLEPGPAPISLPSAWTPSVPRAVSPSRSCWPRRRRTWTRWSSTGGSSCAPVGTCSATSGRSSGQPSPP